MGNKLNFIFLKIKWILLQGGGRMYIQICSEVAYYI